MRTPIDWVGMLIAVGIPLGAALFVALMVRMDPELWPWLVEMFGR